MDQHPDSAGRRRVLFVDDEPRVLDGLRKALYRYRLQWTCDTVTSGDEALRRLESERYDAVVSDARMPGLDGEGLLRQVADRFPGVLRVVLSGDVAQATLERLQRLVHQYLSKPVNVTALFSRVEEALLARDRLVSPELQALVCRLGALPALPGTFAEVNRLASSEGATLAQFVEIVEADPAVTANVLRVVNSAWYGLPTRVSSIREAVRLLGIRPLRDVVLATEVFSGGPSVERLRREAIERMGRVAKLVHALGVPQLAAEASTAAILADVGQLVLSLRVPGEAQRIDAAVEAGRERVTVELEVLGASHALVGGVLLTLWNLPATLVETVALHHERRLPDHTGPTLASLVALACRLEELQTLPQPLRGACHQQVRTLAKAFGRDDVEPLLALSAAA